VDQPFCTGGWRCYFFCCVSAADPEGTPNLMSDQPGAMPTTHIVLALIGPDQVGLLERVARTILEAGCNLEDSRMTVLSGFCCIHLACSGNWKTLGKLESQLPRLERETGLAVLSRRASATLESEPAMAYSVDVVAVDQPGIVRALAGFFTQRGVNIRDMQARVYHAQQTSTRMFAANLVVDLPVHQHLAALRGDFLDFCDELNLDGVMDPIKA
jgi:glycine cleavage system transcriptional repressor